MTNPTTTTGGLGEGCVTAPRTQSVTLTLTAEQIDGLADAISDRLAKRLEKVERLARHPPITDVSLAPKTARQVAAWLIVTAHPPSSQELAELNGISRRTANDRLVTARNEGYLRRRGGEYEPIWELLPQNLQRLRDDRLLWR